MEEKCVRFRQSKFKRLFCSLSAVYKLYYKASMDFYAGEYHVICTWKEILTLAVASRQYCFSGAYHMIFTSIKVHICIIYHIYVALFSYQCTFKGALQAY